MKYFCLLVFFILPGLLNAKALLHRAVCTKTSGSCAEVFYLRLELRDSAAKQVDWSATDRLFHPNVFLRSRSFVKPVKGSDSVTYCHEVYFTFIDTGKISIGPFPVQLYSGKNEGRILIEPQNYYIRSEGNPSALRLAAVKSSSVFSILRSLKGVYYLLAFIVLLTVLFLRDLFGRRTGRGAVLAPAQVLLLKLDQLNAALRNSDIQKDLLEETGRLLHTFTEGLKEDQTQRGLYTSIDELKAGLAELRFSGRPGDHAMLLPRCEKLKALLLVYLKEQRP